MKTILVSALVLAACAVSRASVSFENTGTTNGWTTLWQEDGQGFVADVSNPTFKGPSAIQCRTVFRSTYRGRYHTECRKGGQCTMGMDRYYGFAFYLPPDWQFVDQNFNIQQFIGNVNGCSGGQPATMTRVNGHSLITRIVTGPDGCTRTAENITAATDVTAGEWHRIVIHGNWQSDNTGVFEFWYDGVKKISRSGIPTIPNDDTVFNLAVGNYSNGWHDDGFMVGTQAVRDIFIDQVRTGSSYTDVDPDAWAGPEDGGVFALSVNSSASSLTPGSNILCNITVIPFSGFSSNVTLAVRGLPANVTASFSPTNVIDPNQTAVLTLTAASNTVPGDYTLTLTGNSGLLGVTNTIFLTVNELAPTPDTLTVAADNAYCLRSAGTTLQNSSEALQVKRLADSNTRISYARFKLNSFLNHHAVSNLTAGTFHLYVPGTASGGSLSVYGLLDNPAGNTNGFDGVWTSASLTWNNQPAKSALPNDISGTSTALPNANTTPLLGSAGIPSSPGECVVSLSVPELINLLGADSNRQITLLFVNSSATIVSFASLANTGGYLQPTLELVAPVSDFSLSASPGTQTITAGSNATFTATLAGTNGFAADVALSADGVPGVTANFTPATISGSGSATVTFATAADLAPATYIIPITATSGALQHSANVSLTVVAADADGDGISDWWTEQYFGHPDGQAGDSSRAVDDADGDRMSNLAEFLSGTNPTNAASCLLLVSVALQTNGAAVTWSTVGSHTYVVQSASNFMDGFFDVSPPVYVPGSDEATTNFTDGTADPNSCFYRVRLGP